jgi:hypothetical protein
LEYNALEFPFLYPQHVDIQEVTSAARSRTVI